MGFLRLDMDGWPVPVPLARPLGMKPDDPLQRVRHRRRRELVGELLPKLRGLNPLWSDEEILDTVEITAELRLLDEEIG